MLGWRSGHWRDPVDYHHQCRNRNEANARVPREPVVWIQKGVIHVSCPARNSLLVSITYTTSGQGPSSIDRIEVPAHEYPSVLKSRGGLASQRSTQRVNDSRYPTGDCRPRRENGSSRHRGDHACAFSRLLFCCCRRRTQRPCLSPRQGLCRRRRTFPALSGLDATPTLAPCVPPPPHVQDRCSSRCLSYGHPALVEPSPVRQLTTL